MALHGWLALNASRSKITAHLQCRSHTAALSESPGTHGPHSPCRESQHSLLTARRPWEGHTHRPGPGPGGPLRHKYTLVTLMTKKPRPVLFMSYGTQLLLLVHDSTSSTVHNQSSSSKWITDRDLECEMQLSSSCRTSMSNPLYDVHLL